MRNKRKLKNYLLLPKFQLTFVLLNWLTIMITIFCSYMMINQSFNKLRSIGQKMKLSSNSGYMKFLDAQELIFEKNMLIYFSIGLVISLIITMVLSHRVAGPIYKLKMHFSKLDPKDPKEVNFRKGDFFMDLPKVINSKLVPKNKD